ncbi:hypothetical protein KKF34_07675 [Myxococcota bacterium]|nr:hypothetical protein [Myxococcota bacterium]MBU1381167.1 hypothetical protein [Myxococcota bacterium]MBU1496739.1 hypothetical protein [Myxococcota bacterium]
MIYTFIVLSSLFVFSTCSEFKEIISTPDDKLAKKKIWEGNPYEEWEVTTFVYPVIPWVLTPSGIVALEGSYEKNIFRPEKVMLLDLEDGKVIWRKAWKPVYEDTIWNSRSLIVSDWKRILTHAQGDILRFTNLAKGEDIWNRPACSVGALDKEFAAGWCMERLALIDPESGKITKNIRINITPSELHFVDSNLLIADKTGALYRFNINEEKLTYLEYGKKIITIYINKSDIYVFSQTGDDYFIEKLIVEKFSTKVVWSRPLSLKPENYWLHTLNNGVIYPAGFDCIAFDNFKGETLWTSCGVNTKNPPSWDDNGLYMLSSRVMPDSERPLLFIDIENGLQTTLFKNTNDGSVATFMASWIVPGAAINGLIYCIRAKNRIFSLRIAAAVSN